MSGDATGKRELTWGEAGDEPAAPGAAPVAAGPSTAADASISIKKYDDDADEKIQKFIKQYGEDSVLDQISLDVLLVNMRKRISPYAAPLNDTPEKLEKNRELRFIATKMLDHTLGVFEGLRKLKEEMGDKKL